MHPTKSDPRWLVSLKIWDSNVINTQLYFYHIRKYELVEVSPEYLQSVDLKSIRQINIIYWRNVAKSMVEKT